MSYVSDGISPITSIAINVSPNGYLYGLVVNGLASGPSIDGFTLSPVPNYDTYYADTAAYTTISFSNTQSLTQLNAWSQYDGVSYYLTKLEFFLSDGSTQYTFAPKYNSATDLLHVSVIPTGKRFIGFYVGVDVNGGMYNVGWI